MTSIVGTSTGTSTGTGTCFLESLPLNKTQIISEVVEYRYLVWHVYGGHSLHEAGEELVVGAASQGEGPQPRVEGPQLPTRLLVDLTTHQENSILKYKGGKLKRDFDMFILQTMEKKAIILFYWIRTKISCHTLVRYFLLPRQKRHPTVLPQGLRCGYGSFRSRYYNKFIDYFHFQREQILFFYPVKNGPDPQPYLPLYPQPQVTQVLFSLMRYVKHVLVKYLIFF